MLGQMMQTAGADHILWGTDSIWNGSPQSQIERLRRLKMPEKLMEKYKYPDLTDEVKNGILGLNAAKVFGVDVKASPQGDQDGQADAIEGGVSQRPVAEQHAVRLDLGGRWTGDGAGGEWITNLASPVASAPGALGQSATSPPRSAPALTRPGLAIENC